MSQDTQYAPISFIFQSHGITARPILDRAPEGTYLNLNSASEREESALSSRFGSVIITRDPDGTPGGVNYSLPNPIVTLSRLKYNSAIYRYAGDNTGILYRRAGDTQGAYTSIATGLSGQPFSSVAMNCFGSSIPYLFIADQAKMLKDSGTGSPTQMGIYPPNYTANTQVYPPNVYMIDGFANAVSGYTTTNCTLTDTGGFAIPTLAFSQHYTQFNAYLYTPVASVNLKYAFDGCLSTFGASTLATPFNISFIETTDLVSGSYTTLTVTTLTASGAALGNQVQIYGSNNPIFDGYYVITAIISSTKFKVAFTSLAYQNASIGQISIWTGNASQALMFNVYGQPNPTQFMVIGIGGPFNSATTNFQINVYEATIAAATTASIGKTVNLGLAHNNWATTDDFIVLCLGVGDPASFNTISVQFDLNNSGYQEGYFSHDLTILPNAGIEAIVPYYLRMGDFTAFGSAGQNNWTWDNVTGWRILMVTTATATGNVFVNGLYQQWGYGPSSFGGVGYDYRYTYFNAVTQTESNGSPIQAFDTQYGYTASLVAPIAMRQAIQVIGYYSADPQVTHVRIYRRGGTLSANWYLLDQIPNIVQQGVQFFYQDVIPDSQLTQANTLNLANDAPVTSTLQVPVVGVLTTATTGPLVPGCPYDTFIPQQLIASLSYTGPSLVIGQIVVIGTPQNLEQVRVTEVIRGLPGIILRLHHNAGEPVYSFSIPNQALDLIEECYGQLWFAGDSNNPHYLYYSNPGYPENVGPQNYIPVGTPDSPIMAVIKFRGTLYVATLTTWWLIVGGSPPYAQPTGSSHGLVAKHGWCKTESAIWYEAVDGIREFRGADGAYMTLPIEWLFRNDPNTAALTPIVPAVTANLAAVNMAFYNNDVFAVYPGTDGSNHRLIWNTSYSRWRNDDVNATCIFFEKDTNTLLYSKRLGSGYAIVQDQVNDYDDGGWVGGVLVKTPIPVAIQLPYQDVGKPHNPKQFNTLEMDVNTQGQSLAITLNLDDGTQAPVILGPISTTTRQKVQVPINAGEGVEAYRVSPALTISVTQAPIIYQMNLYTAVLAAFRSTYDTYQIKFGTDEFKFAKEGYFDYTSTAPIVVSLYADGATVPYYQFTLPTNPTRTSDPVRERFAPLAFRLWRLVAVSQGTGSNNAFQFWQNPQIRWKACLVGSGYANAELPT